MGASTSGLNFAASHHRSYIHEKDRVGDNYYEFPEKRKVSAPSAKKEQSKNDKTEKTIELKFSQAKIKLASPDSKLQQHNTVKLFNSDFMYIEGGYVQDIVSKINRNLDENCLISYSSAFNSIMFKDYKLNNQFSEFKEKTSKIKETLISDIKKGNVSKPNYKMSTVIRELTDIYCEYKFLITAVKGALTPTDLSCEIANKSMRNALDREVGDYEAIIRNVISEIPYIGAPLETIANGIECYIAGLADLFNKMKDRVDAEKSEEKKKEILKQYVFMFMIPH